jgi:MraZ protein
LDKNAKVVGVGDTIEIWNPTLHDEQYTDSESMSDLAESLDLPLDFNL